MSIFYINGEFVESDKAMIPATDLAVLRGFGAFDFLRTYGAKPFRLKDNIARLRRSCAIIELEFPWTDEEVNRIVTETIDHNKGLSEEFNIRIVVTGGISPDNITPTGKSSLMVMVTPMQALPTWWYTDGAKVITVDIERIYPDSKSTNYIPAIIAQKRAKAQGAIEAIYHKNGMILEGTTTNLFAFYGDKLITPYVGVLAGITRLTVMEISDPHYQVEVRDLPLEEFFKAEELFITAANKQIVPIKQVDDQIFSGGRPGERTLHVMELFKARTDLVRNS
jgi:branched-chain amino acid aminotransferase